MQATVRMTPVLLARLTPRGLGARSAWVMAGGVIVGEFHSWLDMDDIGRFFEEGKN